VFALGLDFNPRWLALPWGARTKDIKGRQSWSGLLCSPPRS
jgi:hypothetical protein